MRVWMLGALLVLVGCGEGEDPDKTTEPPPTTKSCPKGQTMKADGTCSTELIAEDARVDGRPDAGTECPAVPQSWIKEGEQVNCNEEHDCFLSASEQDPCLWDCGRTQNEPDPHNRGWPASVIAARCTDAL